MAVKKGTPQNMYSDNGTNFHGGSAEDFDDEQIRQ